MPYVSNRAAVEAELEQLVRKNAEQFADRAVRLVQESYREPKSGRLYRIGKTPTKADRRAKRLFRSHQASAPGEAPAIDTAALSKGTTRAAAVRISKMKWSVSAGVTSQSGRADVALWLELGTSRIQPRPSWRRALEVLRNTRIALSDE